METTKFVIMKTKPTKIQIIDRVVKHINKQGRALNTFGNCFYLTEDGKYCADSFLLKPSFRNKATGNCYDIDRTFGNQAYQRQYQGHEVDFHIDIQELHDIDYFWNKNNKTLSKDGIKEVARLKKKWL